MKTEILICNPVRTAIGSFKRIAEERTGDGSGAAVAREKLERANLSLEEIGSVIMGTVIQAGNKMNPAGQASLGGGVPVSVPAMTVNLICGSGAQAIVTAIQQNPVGGGRCRGRRRHAEHGPGAVFDGGRAMGYRMGPAEIHDSMLHDGRNDAFSGKHSGWITENLVREAQLTREQQDRFAERSQKLLASVQAAGNFRDSIVGVEIKRKKVVDVFDRDETTRPDMTLAALAKLRPALRDDGTITAGNALRLNSGVSAMIVTARSFADDRSLTPSGRLVGYGASAVEPGMFGLGPVSAVKRAANGRMGHLRHRSD